jgi:hypothetical protein
MERAGDTLYLTIWGWRLRRFLDPALWFPRDQAAARWTKLEGGTGSVFRVRVEHDGDALDLVVKFSRMGQDVPLYLADHFAHNPELLELARSADFNNPFEEFGHLEGLRRHHARPHPMLTKRALAIYSPREQFPLWKLGRDSARIDAIQAQLDRDQDLSRGATRIVVDARRDYVEVFQWVHGIDAEEAYRHGLVTRAEVDALSDEIESNLRTAGYRVFDNKPRHYILRQRPDGQLLRWPDGRIVWALIDFELLQPLGPTPRAR